MVHPLKVTLEQIFAGSSRTLRLTRKVIDQQRGVEQCSSCGGRGAKIQTIRMGQMIQQLQKTCEVCGGNGVSYRQVSPACHGSCGGDEDGGASGHRVEATGLVSSAVEECGEGRDTLGRGD